MRKGCKASQAGFITCWFNNVWLQPDIICVSLGHNDSANIFSWYINGTSQLCENILKPSNKTNYFQGIQDVEKHFDCPKTSLVWKWENIQLVLYSPDTNILENCHTCWVTLCDEMAPSSVFFHRWYRFAWSPSLHFPKALGEKSGKSRTLLGAGTKVINIPAQPEEVSSFQHEEVSWGSCCQSRARCPGLKPASRRTRGGSSCQARKDLEGIPSWCTFSYGSD